jgi:hypothetical protein
MILKNIVTMTPNQLKIPVVKINKKLEEFRGKVLFPEKLKKANDILAKSGLPKVAIKSV